MDGCGTVVNPFEIRTAEDWVDVCSMEDTFGKFYHLMNDIHVNDNAPRLGEHYQFRGKIYGNGYSFHRGEKSLMFVDIGEHTAG